MKKLISIAVLIFFAASCSKKDNGTPAVQQYTVSYNGNGSSGGAAPVDANKYNNGAVATVLGNSGTLVKTGFSFLGWNASASGGGTDYVPGAIVTISASNLTLYAKWHDNSTGYVYTISYNGNGNTSGNVPTDYNNYSDGTQITVSGNTGSLSKNGQDFMNWNTSSDGSGNQYNPGDQITVRNSNYTLYAVYKSAGSGKFIGFDAAGELATKSSLTSSWSFQDYHTLGPNLVAAVWNGSQYVGFDAAGELATKSSLTSSWSFQDYHTLGPNLVAVVWNGSQYVGFDAAGEVATKSSITSSWNFQDYHTLGPNLVAAIWDGSQYVGFDASGELATKATLKSSWIFQDYHTLGPNLVAVIYH